MGKAVLVMDMPDRCVSCYMYHYNRCGAKRYLHVESDTVRPNWCPIRPMPVEKKEKDGDSILIMGHKRGFNDCLKMIGGDIP